MTVATLAVRLERVSGQLDAHLSECSTANIATATALKTIADKIESFERLPMKAVRWLGGIVLAAAITLLVQNFMLHQDTSDKAQAAVVAANQAATGQAVIVQKLDQLKHTSP